MTIPISEDLLPFLSHLTPNSSSLALAQEAPGDSSQKDPEEALQSGNAAERLAAVNQLGQSGGDRALKPLISALRDERSDVRLAAKNFLEEMIEEQLDSSREQGRATQLLEDMIAALISALDERGGPRLQCQRLLEQMFDEMIDDVDSNSSRSKYAINVLGDAQKILASTGEYQRLFARKTAFRAISDSMEAYDGFLRSSKRRNREKGASGFKELFETLWPLLGEDGLGDRREMTKIFDEMLETLETALNHENEEIRLDAAEMGISLIESASWSLNRGRSKAKRLKSNIYDALKALQKSMETEIKTRAENAMKRLKP